MWRIHLTILISIRELFLCTNIRCALEVSHCAVCKSMSDGDINVGL